MVLSNTFFKHNNHIKKIWGQIYGFLFLWNILFGLIIVVLLYFVIPIEAQESKWEILKNLVVSYEDKTFDELIELYLSSENDIKEGVAASIWKKSFNLKNHSEKGMQLLFDRRLAAGLLGFHSDPAQLLAVRHCL